jgi:hypothetical protein
VGVKYCPDAEAEETLGFEKTIVVRLQQRLEAAFLGIGPKRFLGGSDIQ